MIRHNTAINIKKYFFVNKKLLTIHIANFIRITDKVYLILMSLILMNLTKILYSKL